MVSDGFIHQERRWVGAGRHDCVAENGMVASKHPLVGEAGVSVMRKGGNAVDAPRITRETGTVYLDSRYPAAARDRLTSMGHAVDWVDPELKSWADQ